MSDLDAPEPALHVESPRSAGVALCGHEPTSRDVVVTLDAWRSDDLDLDRLLADDELEFCATCIVLAGPRRGWDR